MDEKATNFVADDLPSGLTYPGNGNQDSKEDFEMTHDEMDQIRRALKNDKFREMLNEYAEEVQDPKNRLLFQSELRQLEKQNGNVVHFINPIPGYVLKTSVNGDKKAFINICSNPMIRKMSFKASTQENVDGLLCSIPFAQSPTREDVDKAGKFCNVYDIVVHSETLETCSSNDKLKDQLETTAIEAVEKSFNVKLDRNNIRRPKLKYKGMKHPTMIKYKIGDQPPQVLDPSQLSKKKETPPQPEEPYYSKKERKNINSKNKQSKAGAESKPVTSNQSKIDKTTEKEKQTKPLKPIEWTEPKYSLKYRSHVDMQNYCFDNLREGRSVKAIPEEIVLSVDLPLLKDSSTLEADVVEGGWDFELKAERKAHYRLNLKLPFQVHCDKSKASFDVDKRKLTIVMKTVQKFTKVSLFSSNSDSGNESAAANSDEAEAHSSSLESLTTSSSPDLIDVDVDCHEDESKGVRSIPVQEEHQGRLGERDRDLHLSINTETINPNPEKPKPKVTQAVPVPVKVPTWTNGDVVKKSILKGSPRCRSVSESCLGLHERLSYDEDYLSMESLFYDEHEELKLGESPSQEKSVRFSESIQRQLYRSNSSILGQKKKNQRRSKNKKKSRDRLNSEGSVSSVDEDLHRFASLADEEVGCGDGDGDRDRAGNQKENGSILLSRNSSCDNDDED